MAEWLYEEGIGENRAILVEHGTIVEGQIELPDELRLGTVLEGRLTRIAVPGRCGIVSTARGDILVEPLPASLTKGQTVRVAVVREAIAEPGHPKVAKGVVTEQPLRDGPTLAERIGSFKLVRSVDPDAFEDAGWAELIEEAISGECFFTGGALRMSLTPAMTLFDVDGSLAPAELAVAGAAAAGRAIRRHGIGGSIGIDLPTLPSKADRRRAAASLDAVLPQPFERTAVNGFGFLQVVRRRERQSLPERLRFDPCAGAARALLRRAERVRGAGARLLIAAPAVAAVLEANPAWLEELGRRTGTAIRLQADHRLTTWAAHVQCVQS